ncbi:MAG: DUF3108 domain-containing protein [Muribaculaceae bacterium]|nr:DUF3108 domain-containing protein [Muribaculaceae bacterium]
MKKLITTLIVLIVPAVLCIAGSIPGNETVRYRVMYKWGLINKQAGNAEIRLHDAGSHYTSRLVGRSEPWADKFFMVRDTLNGTMHKDGFRPIFYEKKAHEGSDDKHDTVRFEYGGDGSVTGHCTRRVVKKGELKTEQKQTLHASGPTVDMLTSFYYMRSLPFDKWKKGHKESINIFSGKRKETLTFEYNGIQFVQVGDKRYQCYHVTFKFTGDGGRKTSDNMDAWITTDTRRLPVQLEGKLVVGKVKCEIIN